MERAEPELRVSLLLMNTGPLITLEAALSLESLGLPGVPVYIPDALLFEGTVKDRSLAARDIIDWVQDNIGRVQVVPAAALRNHLISAEHHRAHRTPDLDERAALEVAFEVLKPGEHELAILLAEDAGAIKLAQSFELGGHFVTITTRDFLDGLEAAGRIESAAAVYAAAKDHGRHAARRGALVAETVRRVDSLRRLLGFQ